MSYASEQGVLNAQYNAAIMAQQAEEFRMRPSWHLRPKVFPDGDQWCALYGDSLQTGVAGFGKTPEDALGAFDVAWKSLTPPPPTVAASESAKLRIENYRLHRAMADLQDMAVAAQIRTVGFELCIGKMMRAEAENDHKEWLALHHELYALMKSPNDGLCGNGNYNERTEK